MELSKIASAAYADIQSGLLAMNANPTISLEQLEDEIVEKRQVIIRQLYAKNALKLEDVLVSINCIDVDCADPARCCANPSGKKMPHFEIPQLLPDLGDSAVKYIGSIDRNTPFKVYYDPALLKTHEYKRRGKNAPYVYIEKTPNKNNKFDGWVFNAPFIKQLSIIGVFKDLRQVSEMECCQEYDLDYGIVSSAVKEAIVNEKLNYYRKLAQTPAPNMQIPR